MHQTIGNIIYSGFRGFNLSLFVSLLSSPFFGSGVYLFCVCVSYTFALGSTHFHVPFFSVSCVLLSSFFALFSSVCKSFSFFPFSFTMAFDQTYSLRFATHSSMRISRVRTQFVRQTISHVQKLLYKVL